MRAGYGKATGLVLAVVLGPMLFYALSVLPRIALFYGSLFALAGVAVALSSTSQFFCKRNRQKDREARRQEAHSKRSGIISLSNHESAPQQQERSLGNNIFLEPCPYAQQDSSFVSVDLRFALIDKQGHRRYPQLILGTFQIGKKRLATPIQLSDFARAVLKDGCGGRFSRADGTKKGILGYGGAAREAIAYELDPAIAAQIGVPANGSRYSRTECQEI